VDGEDRARILLEGEIPSPANPPSGCVFNTRCHRAMAGICEVTEPPLIEVAPGHQMRCHIPLEELGRLQAKAKPGDVLYSTMPVAETDPVDDEAVAPAAPADIPPPAPTPPA
jgi:peptide/nickel transport system ATP-binding protein